MSQPKTSPHANIEEKIYKWLFHKIAVNHKKIGNLPICPFLKKYKSQIHIVESYDPMETARVFCDLYDVLDLEAIIVYGDDYEYDDLVDLCDEITNNFKHKDLTVLCMHPDTDQPPLAIDYNFNMPLIILQRTTTLERSRLQLKNTDYYTYFNEDAK